MRTDFLVSVDKGRGLERINLFFDNHPKAFVFRFENGEPQKVYSFLDMKPRMVKRKPSIHFGGKGSGYTYALKKLNGCLVFPSVRVPSAEDKAFIFSKEEQIRKLQEEIKGRIAENFLTWGFLDLETAKGLVLNPESFTQVGKCEEYGVYVEERLPKILKLMKFI
jgi:hypothetical protein